MPVKLHVKGESWTASNLDETPNEIRVRIKRPGDFENDSFRRIDIDKDKGIFAVIGKMTGQISTTIQAYRFEKKKGWNIQKVISWLERNNI